MIKAPKKLIEAALPLNAINEACVREKSIRHGHPSTLHLWWARRPLAAARAVLFSQMVNDPLEKYGENPTPQQKSAATKERNRLFKIIEELVKWENTNNKEVLDQAKAEIRKSWGETCEMNKGEDGFDPDKLPAFHDPFSGGGAIPLEAQRLGLESYASDLNPVATMICKAMIEIPPKFAGRAPVGPIPPEEQAKSAKLFKKKWPGATGLAEDVRRYGLWMREEAKKRIGHLYPQVEVTAEMANNRPDLEPYVGKRLTVIAWLWARTVKSPHPQFSHVDVPLVSSFVLSSKPGKEVWVEPVVEGDKWFFAMRFGQPPNGAEKGTKLGGARFRCLLSGAVMEANYIRTEGRAKRMGCHLMGIVCEGHRERIYIPPTSEHVTLASAAKTDWRPTTLMPQNPRWFSPPAYGLETYGDLFCDRQLLALDTFSELLRAACTKAWHDAAGAWATSSGQTIDERSMTDGGTGPQAYADAISVYLAFAIDKVLNLNSSITTWMSDRGALREVFSRQALPMSWDFAESNLFSNSGGNFSTPLGKIVEVIGAFPSAFCGSATQSDAQTQDISDSKVVSTDPPYYDNIGYADLSDFFYIWLRRNLGDRFPQVFGTLATPKAEELVATPYRHGGKEEAETFFLEGMTAAMRNLAGRVHPGFPVTIYYAFKQSETNAGGTGNAGWETFLEALIRAGFVVTGTWPMQTEGAGRVIGHGTNALSSSIVLVCRKRPDDAQETTRREFLRELNAVMPGALEAMLGGEDGTVPVAPVDMAQAAIGPGMKVYSKYRAVLKADGTRMSVHEAIMEINRYLDEGEEFDAETRFCRDWFKEHGWGEGASGEADVLSRAKGVSVARVVGAGVLESEGGKTKLVKWQDYPEDYDPREDRNRPVWEVCHHLVRIHQRHGTGRAGEFLSMVQEQGETARRLAYLLYTVCERKGMADEARAYNELATGWGEILASSIANAKPVARQGDFGF